jgi:dihydrofolate synthase/folylpolyglutamate synthase
VGTNGKHSFCVTLREIFEKAGYTCNLNISPSLRKFNERYYFSGKYISDEELCNLLVEVEQINDNQSISFHEIITAAWILHASRNKSDVNIMEAGALFRLDSSNVFQKNLCSVIMPIGIDHRDFLKEGTIDEITYEKCSHLLSGSKIFVSEQKNSVLEKIKKILLTIHQKNLFLAKIIFMKKMLKDLFIKIKWVK